MSSSTNTTAGEVKNYSWAILAILTLAQLFMSMGAYAWGPLAPFLRDEFNISRTQIGAITSALYFASVAVAIPSGIMVDRLSARFMLILCLVIMGVPFAALALANNYLVFLVIAAVSGFGYGIINQVSTKGIMYWFTTKTRATAMGIKQTGVTTGGAIVAVLLPALAFIYGWRTAVLVIGILMLGMAVLSLIFYRERPATATIPVSASKGNPSPKTSQKENLRRVLTNPNLIIICLLTPLMAWAQTSISSFLVLYLEETLKFSVGLAGGCLTAAMIAGTAGRVGWGVISDRVFHGDRYKPTVILTIIAFIGALGTAFLYPGAPVWLPFLYSILMGATFIGWNALLITLAAELAGTALAGTVMGILITIGWSGIIIGPPVFGYIADNAGYFWGWLMLAAFGIINALGFIYLTLRNRKSSPPVTT
ncbi:MAG: MFS transporter [Peptococcaceae bacterium]|nr:MAG: MFS transporter [Peptococcaceae bacterium]